MNDMEIKSIFSLICCFYALFLVSCQEVADSKDVLLFTGTESSPRISFYD